MYRSFANKTKILAIATTLVGSAATYAHAIPIAPAFSQVGHHYHRTYKGAFPHHKSSAAYKPVAINTSQDKRLLPVVTSNRIWNGVATTPDGKVFLTFPQVEGPGTQLGLLPSASSATSVVPFPSTGWNTPPNDNPLQGFLHVTAARIGPDGYLWVLDSGIKTGIYNLENDTPIQRIAGGPRLFRFYLNDPSQMRYDIIDFTDYTEADSSLTNFRFNGDTVILTDSGHPGLIVYNLKTNDTMRVLDDSTVTKCHPKFIDNTNLVSGNPNLQTVGVKELEISPDGKTVYFQTVCGPMYKIATHWLTDDVSDDERVQHVEKFANTSFTGGTAIDSAGNLYVSDIASNSILKYTPDGQSSQVVQDNRLSWVSNMWLDGQGNLWLPSSQLGNTPFLNNGQNKVVYPVSLYRINIGALPAPNDHR